MAAWLVPPGVIVAYGGSVSGSNAPSGWAYCNGQSVSNSSGGAYYELFKTIGTAFGGDGNSEFNLPDFRGYFLRGVTGSTATDPNANSRSSPQPSSGNSGNSVGSIQGYATQQLVAGVTVQYGPGDTGSNLYAGYNMNNILGGYIGPNVATAVQRAGTNPSGAETRPLNAYVYYLICLGIVPPSAT